MARRVVLIAYPGAQILDVVGPLEVFAGADRWSATAAGTPRTGSYSVEIAGAQAGPVRMSSGIEVVAARSCAQVGGPLDTLIVAGGEGRQRTIEEGVLVPWVRALAPRARRVASVCTGAFLLAEAGLLAGRRATTHWGACAELAERYPDVRVDPDPIFVRDGNVWTSAGVTAGMDLALAMVEEDLGREAALAVARGLVMFVKRPGGQAQFSAELRAQLCRREPLRELQGWILRNPDADLRVPALAARVGMSPRNFARVFRREVGATPARFVEAARLEAARRKLEETTDGVDAVASHTGFGSGETLRRAFHRRVRVAPSEYRSRFRSTRGAQQEKTRE
jgi:transcriptional regulator GlxA family with amidase domain